MAGVTTALVGFILLALAFPRVVKNKTHYYVALVCVCLIILVDTLAGVPSAEVSGFQKLAHFIVGVSQLVALIALVLSAGGLSASELMGEVKGAYEVIRRGEEEKEVVIPLPESIRQKAAERQAAAGAGGAKTAAGEDEHQVYTIDSAEAGAVNLRKPAEPAKPADLGSIPLDEPKTGREGGAAT